LKSLLERNPENPDNLWIKKGFIFASNDLLLESLFSYRYVRS